MDTTEKASRITALLLQDKNISEMPLTDAIDLYEKTYNSVLQELKNRSNKGKVKTLNKTDLGL